MSRSYAAVMVDNGVDGGMLAALDEADLIELGVKKVHAKKLLLLLLLLLLLEKGIAADLACGGVGRRAARAVSSEETSPPATFLTSRSQPCSLEGETNTCIYVPVGTACS